MLSFRFLFLTIVLLTPLLYANSNFAVIVSHNLNVKEMSKKSVSRIFLSKTKELPNGQRAITLEPYKKEYQELFYKEVCGKTRRQLKRYWATVLFTGKGQPPKKMKKVEDIIEYVKDNNNIIAYVPAMALTSDDIKIVLKID